MKRLGILIGIGVFLTALIAVLIWAVGVSNHEIELKNRGNAQQQVMRTSYDEMYKIVAQQVQVVKDYPEQFKDIFKELIDGRYANDDGTFMKWIQESNPQFSTELYSKLMQSIESERIKFKNAQDMWIDIDRVHKSYRQTFPNKLVIGRRPDLVGDIVTSTVTQKVFETGKDDDVDLGLHK